MITKIIIIALSIFEFITPFFSQNSSYNCSPKYNNNEKKCFAKLPRIKEPVLIGITAQKAIIIQHLGAGGVTLTKGKQPFKMLRRYYLSLGYNGKIYTASTQ